MPLLRTRLRSSSLLLCLGLPLVIGHAQSPTAASLPDAPSSLLTTSAPAPVQPALVALNIPPIDSSSSSAEFFGLDDSQAAPATAQTSDDPPKKKPITAAPGTQPHRILGLMPNYRTVSAGSHPTPPGFKQSFGIATHQALDYSSFIFLGLTTASAYWEDSHPSLDTWNGGHAPFYAYLWRGFLDKTDQTYQSAWILPTLLHEDTRYYAMGTGNPWKRLGYAMSRIAIARTYSGHNTINLAGLGGKAGAQAVSTLYYPPASETFGVLATKFAYSCARDMGFTVFREFYPDIAVHVLHRNP